MKTLVSLLIIGACLTALSALRLRRADDDDDLNLNPTVNKTAKICKTKDGREGQCFHESMCSESHVFQPFGIIDDSEIRRKEKECPGQFEWCCTVEGILNTTVKPDRSNVPIAGCKTGQKDSCPWCVALYRDKGNPFTKSPSGLFCGGAIIGSRMVLTSTACVLAASTSKLWVRLPGSTKNYTVSNSTKNPQYRSGTGEHDLALLLLNEDVVWPDGQIEGQGACLGLRTPLEGACMTVGFDDNDRIQYTSMSVTAGSCTEQGSTYDAGCGRASGSCSVVQGSPVLCPSDVEGLIVTGVVRQPCIKNSVLVGSLEQSADWVRESLAKNAVTASSYTI